jgi:hypothetical protein
VPAGSDGRLVQVFEFEADVVFHLRPPKTF